MFFSSFLKSLTLAKKVAYLGIFTAFSVIVNIFSIPLADLQFSLTFTVCFLAGTLFGGIGGLAVGAIGDILGVLIQGNAPLWFVTLNTACLGFLSGVIMNIRIPVKGGAYIKAVIAFIVCFIVCTCGINAYGFYGLYGAGATFTQWVNANFPSVAQPYFLYVLYRLIVKGQLVISVVNYALSLLLIPAINAVKPLKVKIE